MKSPDDAYTIMIFRGATTNPLRLKIRKVTVRRAAITGLVLFVLQIGILAHYIFQTTQVAELNGLREEIAQSRGQTSAFSTAIDEMKQKMLALQQLNRKLQTMFGLEADQLDLDVELVNGQGGEEIPFEIIGDKIPLKPVNKMDAPEGEVTYDKNSRTGMVSNIENGLVWLDSRAAVEKAILDKLASTAGKRVTRWSSTPSIWPVKGPLTSKFGPRKSPFTGKKAFHSGLDIGSPTGTPIHAPASGRVVVAGYDTRMGNFIRINHGYGMETTYGHLSKVLVKYGHKVKRGDLIGLVGSTGKFSTGPHLHYQVAVNDKVVNPSQYILD